MLIDGIEVPDQFAKDPAMREAFLIGERNKPKPADPPATPAGPPDPPADPPAPTAPPADPPAPPAFSESEYNELKAKHAEAEAKLAELNKKVSIPTKINDPDLYRLAIIKEKSPEKFSTFAALKINKNLSPLDLLIDDYIEQNPEYKDKRDMVSSFLKNSYGMDKPIPDPLDPSESEEEEVSARAAEIEAAKKAQEFGEMRMKSDAKSVLSKLETEFNAIELPESVEKTPEQIEQEKAQAITGWTPIAEKVFESLKSIPIYVQDKEAKEATEFLSFEIPQDMVPVYKKQLVDFCVSNHIPLTQEGVAHAAGIFISSFKRENEARIMDSVVKKARKLTEIEYDAMYSNPSSLKDQIKRDELPAESPAERSRREAAAAEGVKY